MSLGTLFGSGQTRSIVPEGLVKALKLDVKVLPSKSPEHLKNFPLGKVAAFLGPHGLKIHEVIAVSYYLIKLHDENSPLLGKTLAEQAKVLQYQSFATSDFATAVADVLGSVSGKVPYNKKAVESGREKIDQYAGLLEERLVNYTYLVGERLTVADLFLVTAFYRPFTVFLGTKWRSEHPILIRWYNTVSKSEYLSWFFDDLKLADEPILHPPKKEHKKGDKEGKKEGKKEAKKEPKKEKKPEEAVSEAGSGETKKPKHPLEVLGRSKIPIDQWKRVYSNEDTRTGALPYFWKEFYDPAEWSLYKVEYKYNDELTLTFMSNNLIGGFFARLLASTKYLFGCMVVYGENNNNGITGAFLVRGQDYKPAFDVAPDWESYEFTKLDAAKPEDKAYIENMWAWDEPVFVNGEKKEIADGKVFK
ncbi:DEKNAAC104153 [Brettanomyces naardenensis]|uniref:DEKNAAC104153 n=1 Tax=Brettanomyces naardenensis TaxID=13370 RepID=A0A448YPT8_BRENA|nr:DEKNAAC104153 [Brettanomyces naardenensis]